MALVHPSVILQVFLGPQDYSEHAVKEIKRSYIYIAQSLVKELPEEELDEGNIMRLSIRLMKPYWDTSDAQACELWDTVMPKWLRNISRNLSNAMNAYNKVRHPFGIGRIHYTWADFEFDDNATLRVRLDRNEIPQEMPELADKARALLCSGAFGEGDIARVRIPSNASYAEQLEKQAHDAVDAQDEAEVAPEPSSINEAGDMLEVDRGPEGLAVEEQEPRYDSENEESGMFKKIPLEAEVEEPEEQPQEDEQAQEVVASETADEPSDPLQRPRSSIDYSIWGIEFADGTVVEFDTSV